MRRDRRILRREAARVSSRVDGVGVWRLGNKHGASGQRLNTNQDQSPAGTLIFFISTLTQLLVLIFPPQFQRATISPRDGSWFVAPRHNVAPTSDQTPGAATNFCRIVRLLIRRTWQLRRPPFPPSPLHHVEVTARLDALHGNGSVGAHQARQPRHDAAIRRPGAQERDAPAESQAIERGGEPGEAGAGHQMGLHVFVRQDGCGCGA